MPTEQEKFQGRLNFTILKAIDINSDTTTMKGPLFDWNNGLFANIEKFDKPVLLIFTQASELFN